MVDKSRCVRFIMSSSPYMYLFIEYYVILYSVWLLLLLCFCCVLYNLNGRVLLCEIEFSTVEVKRPVTNLTSTLCLYQVTQVIN